VIHVHRFLHQFVIAGTWIDVLIVVKLGVNSQVGPGTNRAAQFLGRPADRPAVAIKRQYQPPVNGCARIRSVYSSHSGNSWFPLSYLVAAEDCGGSFPALAASSSGRCITANQVKFNPG
jgi:hypothetical protein